VDSSRFHSSPIPFLPHILSKILLIGERWPKHNNKIIYLKLILMVLFSKTVKNSDEESLIIVKISIQWILMCRTHRPNRIGHRSYVVEIQGHKKNAVLLYMKNTVTTQLCIFQIEYHIRVSRIQKYRFGHSINRNTSTIFWIRRRILSNPFTPPGWY
jgi:hypothetical protein